MKRTPIRTAKADPLDTLFSEVVRRRANGRCERCLHRKSFEELQCSHYKGRSRKSVRWDLDNAAGLCLECHKYLEEHPEVHREWFRDRLGERFDLLNIRAEQIAKNIDRAEIEHGLRGIEG